MILEIIVAIFLAWGILLYAVKKKGGEHFSLIGPLIMWKTEKGKKLVDRIAKYRAWKTYGDISIIIVSIAMILTTWLVIRSVYLSFKIKHAISPRLIIGLPGINPVIPIGYGIVAIALAIIFHEFSHGILARVAKIKINSLGLLFLILPVGAFVEPDEEKLMEEKRIKRARVFAAGPSTNIIIAIVSILLLAIIFSPAITPKENGVIVGTSVENIPAWSMITNIDGHSIHNIQSFNEIVSNFQAGKQYNITYMHDGKTINGKYVHGIIVSAIVKDSPAEKNGIKAGCVIYEINGEKMNNISIFQNFMNSTNENEKINISYYYHGSFNNITITLADKYAFTHDKNDKGKGFIGVEAVDVETLSKFNLIVMPSYFANLYNPFKTNFFVFVSLPFHGLSPFPKELVTLYNVPVATIFWPLLNFIYWIFWLNFALGTFNALPALPLDGGYIFKDGISWLAEKMRYKKYEKLAAYISSAVSYIIIIAIFAMILIPNIRAML